MKETTVSYWYDRKNGCVWFEQERAFSDVPSALHKELIRVVPSTIVRMSEKMWQGEYRTEIAYLFNGKGTHQVVFARLDDIAKALKQWLRPLRKHSLVQKVRG